MGSGGILCPLAPSSAPFPAGFGGTLQCWSLHTAEQLSWMPTLCCTQHNIHTALTWDKTFSQLPCATSTEGIKAKKQILRGNFIGILSSESEGCPVKRQTSTSEAKSWCLGKCSHLAQMEIKSTKATWVFWGWNCWNLVFSQIRMCCDWLQGCFSFLVTDQPALSKYEYSRKNGWIR